MGRKFNDGGDEPCALGEGKCTRSTDKALLVRVDDKDIWIPKSCVHDDSDVFDVGHEGKVIVKQWWAEKNGHV